MAPSGTEPRTPARTFGRKRGSRSGCDARCLSTGRSIRAWRTLCERQMTRNAGGCGAATHRLRASAHGPATIQRPALNGFALRHADALRTRRPPSLRERAARLLSKGIREEPPLVALAFVRQRQHFQSRSAQIEGTKIQSNSRHGPRSRRCSVRSRQAPLRRWNGLTDIRSPPPRILQGQRAPEDSTLEARESPRSTRLPVSLATPSST